MDWHQPALDWERGKHGSFFWSLPALSLTKRDRIWLVVIVSLIAFYGVDRWWNRKRTTGNSSAVAEAQATAKYAQDQARLRSDQLRNVQQAKEALAAQHQEDLDLINKLSFDVASLQEELQKIRASLYTSGRTSRER